MGGTDVVPATRSSAHRTSFDRERSFGGLEHLEHGDLAGRAAEPVSARALSALVGLHPAYLNRVFSARVGMPPHAYLTDLRVQRARELLAAGRPLSGVAYDTGFADQSHLTRCFKRAVGITPGAYQDQVRGRIT